MLGSSGPAPGRRFSLRNKVSAFLRFFSIFAPQFLFSPPRLAAQALQFSAGQVRGRRRLSVSVPPERGHLREEQETLLVPPHGGHDSSQYFRGAFSTTPLDSTSQRGHDEEAFAPPARTRSATSSIGTTRTHTGAVESFFGVRLARARPAPDTEDHEDIFNTCYEQEDNYISTSTEETTLSAAEVETEGGGRGDEQGRVPLDAAEYAEVFPPRARRPSLFHNRARCCLLCEKVNAAALSRCSNCQGPLSTDVRTTDNMFTKFLRGEAPTNVVYVYAPQDEQFRRPPGLCDSRLATTLPSEPRPRTAAFLVMDDAAPIGPAGHLLCVPTRAHVEDVRELFGAPREGLQLLRGLLEAMASAVRVKRRSLLHAGEPYRTFVSALEALEANMDDFLDGGEQNPANPGGVHVGTTAGSHGLPLLSGGRKLVLAGGSATQCAPQQDRCPGRVGNRGDGAGQKLHQFSCSEEETTLSLKRREDRLSQEHNILLHHSSRKGSTPTSPLPPKPRPLRNCTLGFNCPPSQAQLHLTYAAAPWFPAQAAQLERGEQLPLYRHVPYEYVERVLQSMVADLAAAEDLVEDRTRSGSSSSSSPRSAEQERVAAFAGLVELSMRELAEIFQKWYGIDYERAHGAYVDRLVRRNRALGGLVRGRNRDESAGTTNRRPPPPCGGEGGAAPPLSGGGGGHDPAALLAEEVQTGATGDEAVPPALLADEVRFCEFGENESYADADWRREYGYGACC